MSHIAENLQRVEKRIEEACVRAGRDRGEVTLIAVSKTKPVSDIQEAMACGITVFGGRNFCSVALAYDRSFADQ